MIIAGYTAYSPAIDFKKFREIADAVDAYLIADVSHLAGIIAGGAYPSPFPHAHVVTTTTHKTLRGPRSAVIFSQKELSKQIDKTVFPGLQGGPHEHQIAAVATTFYEAMQPGFKKYAHQIVKNAQALADELEKLGWRIVSGGTDSHLMLVDTADRKIGGKEAAVELEKANIVTNMNTIPYDPRPPMDPSGIRIGSPACTTRGMKEPEMQQIAKWIDEVLSKKRTPDEVRKDVLAMCEKFPLEY